MLLQQFLLNILDWVKRHRQQLTVRRLADSLLLIVLVPATSMLPAIPIVAGTRRRHIIALMMEVDAFSQFHADH